MGKISINLTENEVVDLMVTLTASKFCVLSELGYLDKNEDAESVELGKLQLQKLDNLMAILCRSEVVEK